MFKKEWSYSEDKMIDSYLSYIQEGYLLSDKSISVGLDDFKSGRKNKLLIIGVPGSGKTSLAKYLAKKYNAGIVSDTHWREFKKALLDSKRTIIEGAGLASLYKADDSWRKMIIDKPIILIGLSAIRSGLRADVRDGMLPTTVKNKKDMFYFIRNIFIISGAGHTFNVRHPFEGTNEKFERVLN